ncbi:hypothetical protein ACFSO9_16145 [Mesonia maritima]|uniref:hypothetical protein n=1 Tax=Mesonia maritima TaxID=1793873 RepID=UPI0036372C00
MNKLFFSDSYVYIAEYYTEGDLQDGQGEREAHHLFMSLPTSLEDQRLPIPLDIKEIKPGVYYGYDGETFSLTDDDGYSYDGKTRYISIFSEEETNTLYNPPFYISYNEFFAHSFTYPVYTGLRHRLNSESQWRKPELSNDEEYQYLKSNGSIGENETIPLLPPENGKPLYVHNQTESGVYHYNPYGINWFSRAKPSERVVSITTNIQPKNNLLPPSNLKPVLVQPEEPLLFTSAEDQELLNTITLSDKTLVRLSFNFNTKQDLISYTVDDDSITNADYEQDPELVFSDSDEVFADKVQVFFRENLPLKISGKATGVQNHPSDPFLALINTGPYDIGSSGGPLEQIVPSLDNGDETRFVGGVINIGNQNYIIQQVNNSGNWPQFSVYKKLIGDQLTAIVPSDDIDPANLEMPVLSSDGLFMATENMQDEMNWASANPMNFEIQIGNNWNVHREILELTNEAGDTRRILEKSRGIWSEENQGHSLVEKFFEEEAILDSNGEPQYDTNNNLVTQTVHKGLYKITFHGVNLAHHPQFNTNVNQPKVDWYKGIVRLFTEEALQGSTPTLKRKVLDVITIENIGTTNDLVVYAQDTTFNDDSDYDEVATGNNLTANFYPGYKAHLYSDQAVSLNETNTLPDEEDSKYTIFGLRVTESNYNYESNIGAPGLMLAQKIVLPQQPEPPEGSLYATRPDYFGRATYTFTTKYNHQPHGVLFYRTSEESLLHALYSRETIAEIRTALENLGGNDEDYLTNRWQNFFDFNTLITDGDYSVYPPAGVSDDGYKFPNPDKAALFDWANHVLSELGQPLISANPGTLTVGDPVLIEFVKGAIFNAFVPLTEVPILYQYIPNSSYQPIDKNK